MSKVKKLLAMLMAVVMTLGMSVTAFAANGTETITVSGLASTGTNHVTYYKILEPDVEEESGYKFLDNVIIKKLDEDGKVISNYTNAKEFLEAGVDNQKKSLSHEDSELGTAITPTVNSTTFTATVEAGYYAVFITNTAEEGDPTIIYNSPMIVSVGYDKATPVTGGGYEYNAVPGSNSVVAKYTTIPIEKDADSETGEIGSTKTYTIETYIPSEVTSFVLKDELTGATYKKDSSTSVLIEGSENNIAADTVGYDDDGNMIITLTGYLNGNAGKKVTISYTVTVTATIVNNTVIPNDGKHTYTPATDRIDTGAIKLLKKGEGTDANGLADAKFVVYKKVDTTPDDGSYATTDMYLKETTGDTKAYSWTPNIDEATRYTTQNAQGDTKGTILIEGLDVGTYWFKEVEAPSDYSINTTDVSATIDADNLTSANKPIADPAEVEMTDTKLASLPSTGGIGTTIFTIGGCLIMIVAAGLFFATRRKAEK